jgi:proteasome lid subunit RPN8/RPN11
MTLDELAVIMGRQKLKTKDELEHKKEIKSIEALVKPKVISDFFNFASSAENTERVGMLSGSLEGKSIVITGMHPCKKAEGTAATVNIDPQEWQEMADGLDRGCFPVGWVHSHPGYGVFLSPTDIETQRCFQGIFSNSIACVMDPFAKSGIEFGFFRLVDEKVKKIDNKFLVRHDNEAL